MDHREFEQGWQRRFGNRNPQRMAVPFWDQMIRVGANSYNARELAGHGDEVYEYCHIWCFERNGQTRTRLPDGRVVCVGGEHEDASDPDFCIYNDVVVFERWDGPESFAVYGYPEAEFPPTDGHTATLVGDDLWLIGNVGYHDRRSDRVQVYRLHTQNMRIDHVPTSGDQPGWIGRHRAALTANGSAIVVGGGVGKQYEGSPPRLLGIATQHWQLIENESLPWNPGPDVAADGLTPIRERDFNRLIDTLRREIPPGHPLFGIEIWPVAELPNGYLNLWELRDGSGRFAIAEPAWAGRSDLPEPPIELLPDYNAALNAIVDHHL